jgi:hypothetical protein
MGNIDMAVYELPTNSTNTNKTSAEQFSDDESYTEKNRMNEMIVISNTTSAEDFKEIEEEGFSLSETDSHTIITVTDKIKATLAKAGVDISGYGDELTKEQIKEITGSDAVTDAIMQALKANDLPTTEDNLEDCIDGLTQVASLDEISDATISYLLKNELEPTIRNLYVAEHSGSAEVVVNPEESGIDFDELMPQIEEIIESADLTADTENIENSEWLVANKIPLTQENLQYLADLKDLSGKLSNDEVDWGQILDNMAKAVTEGKRPQEALLITARRQLEETRLAMTTESENVMNQKGIEVDTKPLEKLVEDLKAQEKEYYSTLLTESGTKPAEEQVDAMAQTMDYLEEMKGQPSYVLGQISETDTIQEIHDTGAKLQQELSLASERYETLMTLPRRDMGDSIQKAFSNVVDILNDLAIEPTEANRRAVRILGYNQMAITAENIMEVKELDEQMQRTFKNMTPAVTLEMIRKGENPLDMTMEEINTAAEQIREEQGYEEQERFSKYLYKLEQDNDISEEERSSYIGIYRLIAQVEKSDGAAIGFLNKEGADVTMRNLLQAIRSSKKGKIDYQVSDDFDGVEAKSTGVKIDDQINAGFTNYQQNCLHDVMDRISPERLAAIGEENWENMTPEQLAEALEQAEESETEKEAMESYIKEQLDNYSRVLDTPQEVYSYLEHYDMPNTMSNVLAASEMLRTPNRMMDRLFRKTNEKLDELKEEVLDSFDEALSDPDELSDAQENLTEMAEEVMDKVITEEPDVSTRQIRDMRQMVAEFKLCEKRTEEECYMIPVKTGDTVTGVSLRIVRGKEEKGIVDISLDAGGKGKIAATFQANENGISALIAAEDSDTAEEITEKQQELEEQLGEECDLHIANIEDLSLSRFELSGAKRAKEEGNESTGEVQTKRLYHIAEAFIRTVCA